MRAEINVVKAEIEPFGVTVDAEKCDNINKYIDLLNLWNRKVSLTTVTDVVEILRFHFGESVFALQYCDFSRGRLADVGSGAGFPGLALKLFCPDLEVLLLEPNLKKSTFLAEIVRELNLSSVEIISKPFLESSIPSQSLQFVTSRALAQTSEFLKWSAQVLAPGGSLILWVSAQSADDIRRFAPFQWETPRPVPGTRNRAILVGRKSD